MGVCSVQLKYTWEYKMFLMKFFALILPIAIAKNLTEVPRSITSICIETGDVWLGGTDSDVYITLHGSSGSCTTYVLDKDGYNDFESGDYDCYYRADGLGSCTDANIGTLSWAGVHLDGDDDWYCERIRIGSQDCYISDWLEEGHHDDTCKF